jgi:hypothetical protein
VRARRASFSASELAVDSACSAVDSTSIQAIATDRAPCQRARHSASSDARASVIRASVALSLRPTSHARSIPARKHADAAIAPACASRETASDTNASIDSARARSSASVLGAARSPVRPHNSSSAPSSLTARMRLMAPMELASASSRARIASFDSDPLIVARLQAEASSPRKLRRSERRPLESRRRHDQTSRPCRRRPENRTPTTARTARDRLRSRRLLEFRGGSYCGLVETRSGPDPVWRAVIRSRARSSHP